MRKLDPPRRPKKYLSGPQVRKRYGDLGPVSLWKRVKEGKIPPPTLKHGPRNYWDEQKLDEHDAASSGAETTE